MPTLLVRNATLLVTMDDARRRIPGGGLYVKDQVIRQVGPTAELPQSADRVIDAHGTLILPGLVNTHHHLFQSLTRALPAAQNVEFAGWLRALYPVWAGLTGEAVYTSALVGLSELLLSGCTTVADQLYVYPYDSRIDHSIQAARELGVRFHPGRGCVSLGRAHGRLAPDELLEDQDQILADCDRVALRYHDPGPYSMCRVVLAPASVSSVTPGLMSALADFARARGLQLHTHVAETRDEVRLCVHEFGLRPAALMHRLGWVGPDVWWAHCVHVDQGEIALMADTGTGVATCPNANMRLGVGIAPVRTMLDAGVRVGLAVDGSAGNDSGHMLSEVRQAMLLQRVAQGASALTAEEALWLGTRGGAMVLGRDDIGSLAPGMAADFISVRLDQLAFAGAQVDPLAAMVFCTPPTVDLSVINGRVVVEHGQLVDLDHSATVERHNELAQALVQKSDSENHLSPSR